MKNEIINWKMIKEAPSYVRLLLIVGVAIDTSRSLYQILLMGKGNIFEFIFYLAGSLFVIAIISLLIEIIPFLLLRNKIANAHIKILVISVNRNHMVLNYSYGIWSKERFQLCDQLFEG